MDSRGKIIFTSKKTRKPAEHSEMPTHEELEFHFDEDRKKWYYEADDLIPEDDSDDQCNDEAHTVQSAKAGLLSSPNANRPSQTSGEIMARPAEDEPLKYPDAYRPSQAFLDRINSQKPKPGYYDEVRDLYYVIDDDLVPLEEAVEGSVKDVKSDAVSVINQGIFSTDVKPKNQNETKQDPIVECDQIDGLQNKM